MKGRETSRLGPLRGAHVVASSVAAGPVPIDAGTNVLTDSELMQLAHELPTHLEGELARRRDAGAAVVVGEARVLGCRVDAGPGRAYTLYQARCRVALMSGDVSLMDVHTQAVRRVRSRAISEDEARAIQELERNPLLSVDDTRAVLGDALVAAAQLMAGEPLPASASTSGRPPPRELSPGKRRALAVARFQRAAAGDGDVRAALHDLAVGGAPADSAALVAFMRTQPAHDVPADAIHALGMLCDPSSAPALERLRTSDPPSPYEAEIARAEARLRACASLPPPIP